MEVDRNLIFIYFHNFNLSNSNAAEDKAKQ